METASAVAALGDSGSLYFDLDPLQEQTPDQTLQGMQSQNPFYYGNATNGREHDSAGHTSHQTSQMHSLYNSHTQGQLPRYDNDTCNTQPVSTDTDISSSYRVSDVSLRDVFDPLRNSPFPNQATPPPCCH